jgi:hypothetical protein
MSVTCNTASDVACFADSAEIREGGLGGFGGGGGGHKMCGGHRNGHLPAAVSAVWLLRCAPASLHLAAATTPRHLEIHSVVLL